MLPLLPLEIEHLIHEYNEDPDKMVLSRYGKPFINRNSPFIKELGGLLLMRCYYRLYHTIYSSKNNFLYLNGKNYYK